MRLSARTSYFTELVETLNDYRETFSRSSLAFSLATQDILARYRGSVLGPWWITITVGALVLGIGVNYASLFHQTIKELLPYVAVGLVVWGYLSTSLSEGGEAFFSAGQMIRQSALPLPIFILRCQIRGLIILLHQLVIIIGVFAWLGIFPGLGCLWAVLGLALILVNVSWLGFILAVFSARFRDVPQIVSAALQFIFFLSPIFWTPTEAMLGNPFIRFNPFFLAVQSVRAPLLNGAFPQFDDVILAPLGVVGWLAATLIYTQSRRSIVHYL